MNDDLHLPPARPLPPEVHDRVLARVQRSIATGGHRGLLTAAASVAAVVAVAVVVTTVARSPEPADVVGAPPASTPADVAPSTPTPTTSRPTSPDPTPTPAASPTPAGVTAAPAATTLRSTSSTAPPTTTRPVPRPSSPPAAAPAFAADTADQAADAVGQSSVVNGVAVTARDGYDEVVLDVSGEPGAVPGFRVGYVDTPVGDPTGQPVAVSGQAHLQVFVSGVSAAPPAPDIVRGSFAGAGAVREVVAAAAFEGYHQFLIGLDAQRAFRVRTSADPGRVIIQILTP